MDGRGGEGGGREKMRFGGGKGEGVKKRKEKKIGVREERKNMV